MWQGFDDSALISHEHVSQAASSSSITSLALRRLEMFTGVWQVYMRAESHYLSSKSLYK